MRLTELAGKRVGIVGLGQEGRAVLARLLAVDDAPDLVIFDETGVSGEVPGQVPVIAGPLDGARLAEREILVTSPGISVYRPALRAAVEAGARLTTGTNLWFAESRPFPVVAVTGTKGKSTVASLVAHLARAAGVDARLGGNIGTPLLDLAVGGAELVVAELSSYQAALFEGTPSLAVLTNLFPEHLDWHGTEERYYADKLRLVAAADRAVVNVANAAAEARTRSLSERIPALGDTGWRVADGAVAHDQARYEVRWSLRGGHNLANLALAAAALDALGMDPCPGLAALEDFSPLPHRQAPVAEHGGILYVDDSIATTPFATIAALEAFSDRPVAVIVGGYDRGLDWSPFAAWLADHPVRRVIVRGANRDRILTVLDALAPQQARSVCDGLAEAVSAGRDALPEGGAILLSPGAPSFGEFSNFRERGAAFARLARSDTGESVRKR